VLQNSSTIQTLSRDLPTNELVGRKFFIDLAKWFPDIRLLSATSHEDQYWGSYVISLPYPVNTLSLSNDAIQVEAYSKDDKHTLSLRFNYQDPNNTTLPISSRTLLQNIIKQLQEQKDDTKERTETNHCY
jgi:hypothetical protein